jgi:cell wall-associated NlpC family hydrolase
MLTAAQRAAVLAEARTWIGTPYHHMGRVKGAGVDCATLLMEVFARAGVIAPATVDFYPPDWHLHRSVERYLGELLKYGREIEGAPQPADVLVVKFGRVFSHGAIVVQWPVVIHAMLQHPVSYADALREAHFTDPKGGLRPMRFFAVEARR